MMGDEVFWSDNIYVKPPKNDIDKDVLIPIRNMYVSDDAISSPSYIDYLISVNSINTTKAIVEDVIE